MRTTRLKDRPCPKCGKILNASTDPNGLASPSEGDATVCLGCAGILLFDKNLDFRIPNQSELAEIAREDPTNYSMLLEMQTNVRKLQHDRKSN